MGVTVIDRLSRAAPRSQASGAGTIAAQSTGMAKKLLVARALTTGLLALGACTGNPGEPPPVDAAPTDGGHDGCVAPPCGVAPDELPAIAPPATVAR